MILGFSTQLNGKPTLFTNKIVKGMWQTHSSQMNEFARSMKLPDYYVFEDLSVYDSNKLTAKLHTIREDKKERWKPGTKIDFFINCRQPTMFRFAPVLPVVSIQKVKIKWFNIYGDVVARVFIDGKSFAYVKFKNDTIVTLEGEMLQLAHNDGFDTIEDFFAYFNKDFTGKIIHWTDKRY